MNRVSFGKIEKLIGKLPRYVVKQLHAWAEAVELKGLIEVRKIPGYHDEPLKGRRSGQRSIRLNRSYRAIYTEENDGIVNTVTVEEVNKHEY